MTLDQVVANWRMAKSNYERMSAESLQKRQELAGFLHELFSNEEVVSLIDASQMTFSFSDFQEFKGYSGKYEFRFDPETQVCKVTFGQKLLHERVYETKNFQVKKSELTDTTSFLRVIPSSLIQLRNTVYRDVPYAQKVDDLKEHLIIDLDSRTRFYR